MKTPVSLLFVVLTCFLFGCKSEKRISVRKTLVENNMDFSKFRRVQYRGIVFDLPEEFKKSPNHTFTLKKNALVENIEDLFVNFSVERFSLKEIDKYKQEFEFVVDDLNTLHDHYIEKRCDALVKNYVSIKKEIVLSKKRKGLTQSICGSKYEGGISSTYIFATLRIKSHFYVFQFIGNRNTIGYLYDDFKKIIKSVRKA